MAGRIDPVELEIPLRQRDRACVAVHRDHLAHAAERCADREASRVRKAVHRLRPSASEPAQREAILALIEEISGLLPPAHVHRDAHAVLAHDQLYGRLSAPEHLAARRRTFARNHPGSQAGPWPPADPANDYRRAQGTRHGVAPQARMGSHASPEAAARGLLVW